MIKGEVRGTEDLYIDGEVVRTFAERDARHVEIAQTARNQDDEPSVTARAVVRLPSRERTPAG